WTLGPGVGANGANTVNAVVSGVGTATFSATATAGTPSGSNTAVSASPNNITVGSGSSTITVTVRDASDNPVAGAAVSVSSSGTGNNISPASASSGANGVATFTFSSSVAETKTITATAGGVEVNQKPTIVVQKAASTTRITSDEPDASTAGQVVRVEFTVSGSGGTPTGDVNVTLSGGSESCTGTVAQGFCEITPLAPGNPRTLTATYVGDAQFTGSNDTERHRVNPAAAASTTTTITTDNPDPSQVGDAVTVTFTVTSSGGTPTGDVTVTDPVPGSNSCTASVAAGSCSYTPGGTGPRTITATYVGNSAFNTSSDTEQHDVNTPPTAVDDEYQAQPGVPFPPNPSGTLTLNDSKPETADGDVYTTSLASLNPTAKNGQVTVNPDGSFTYTSDPAATGDDTFQYRLDDGRGGSSVATVTMHLVAPIVAGR
ncbi:MAG: Ig-like domain repeat protein, partial [Gemmatimonadales bacterium]